MTNVSQSPEKISVEWTPLLFSVYMLGVIIILRVVPMFFGAPGNWLSIVIQLGVVVIIAPIVLIVVRRTFTNRNLFSNEQGQPDIKNLLKVGATIFIGMFVLSFLGMAKDVDQGKSVFFALVFASAMGGWSAFMFYMGLKFSHGKLGRSARGQSDSPAKS